MANPVPSTSSAIPAANPTLAAREGNAAFATSLGLLLLRLALGATFIYHGGQNSFGWFAGPGVEEFAKHTPPLPVLSPVGWAWVSALSQVICGVLLVLGLLTRLATLPLIANMLVAIASVHAKNGFSNVNAGYEFNLAIIAMCGALLLSGPGLVSADAFLFRRGLWARGAQPMGDPRATRES